MIAWRLRDCRRWCALPCCSWSSLLAAAHSIVLLYRICYSVRQKRHKLVLRMLLSFGPRCRVECVGFVHPLPLPLFTLTVEKLAAISSCQSTWRIPASSPRVAATNIFPLLWLPATNYRLLLARYRRGISQPLVSQPAVRASPLVNYPHLRPFLCCTSSYKSASNDENVPACLGSLMASFCIKSSRPIVSDSIFSVILWLRL